MCPYCGCGTWVNSWGMGNALCARCSGEFVVGTDGAGGIKGFPLPTTLPDTLPGPLPDDDEPPILPFARPGTS